MKIILTSFSFLVPKFILYFFQLMRVKKSHNALLVCVASRNKFKPSIVIAVICLSILRIKTQFVKQEQIPKDNYDLIIVFGGNTFKLMQWVLKSNFLAVIQSTIQENGIYIGESAGAIILSPSIELASIVNADKYYSKIANYAGLKIINFVPLLHYRNKYESLILNYEKNSGLHVQRITNGQFIVL